jgi:hypothetical protein
MLTLYTAIGVLILFTLLVGAGLIREYWLRR